MATNENNLVRVAVIGMGMSATVFHIPFIGALPNIYKLHSILERSATPEKSLASDKYGSNAGFKVVTTLEEVVNDPEVDLVVISTPNLTHYPYAKAALSAGKHVIVEKPLVPSVSEAEELLKLSKEKNLILATYQNRRWDSDFLTLRKLVEDKKAFGDISELESRYDRFRLEPKEGWKGSSEWGHGVVFDLGSHLIDQVLVLIGTPEKISANVWNSRLVGPPDFHDAFIAHFYYPTGHTFPGGHKNNLPLTVTVHGASISLLKKQLRFTVKGTKASWVKYGIDPQEDQLKLEPPMKLTDERYGVEPKEDSGVLTTLEKGVPREVTIDTEKGDYVPWFENVGKSIQARDRSLLIVKPEQAKETIRMIELIYQSSKEERVVAVPTTQS